MPQSLDHNISEDDRTLLSLRDRQLRTVFEMALDAIAIADDEGRYLDVNPAACELFGLKKDELLGCCISDFTEPGFNFKQVWQQFQQPEKVRGEFQLVRPDGEIRVVEYAATANFLPHRHLLIIRDITERKRAEIKVQELTRQLEQTQAQLREAVFISFGCVLMVLPIFHTPAKGCERFMAFPQKKCGRMLLKFLVLFTRMISIASVNPFSIPPNILPLGIANIKFVYPMGDCFG